MRNAIEIRNRSSRKILMIAFGVIAMAAIATIFKIEFCEGCRASAAIVETEPGVLNDRQVAETLNNAVATEPVTEWNQIAVTLTLSSTATLSPVQQSRVMAIAQVAMHDAVNGITRKYETYLPAAIAPTNATAEAAAIAAGHRALRSLFQNTTQQSMLDAAYASSLASHGIAADDPGLEYGRAAADAILAARANDGASTAQFDYTTPGAGDPGVWTRINNAPALLPGWGDVLPFVIRSSDQFDPGPPYAINSPEFAKDYNEIKEIGRSNSTTRTQLQSDIATFWRASPTAIWNPVLIQALAARDFDISDKARIFALFYVASSDASVTCWKTKYKYNFWRPQLAIRGGDVDGNDATEADPTWTPFLPTPPHPEYSSGHATNSSAMAYVLESMFGKDPGITFTVTLSGITRQWSIFDQAVDEVIDARVYSGIHFRNSDIVGARQGRQVAQFVITHALRPCKGHKCL